MIGMRTILTIALVTLLGALSLGLVNPSLQPHDLCERYQHVLTLQVVEVEGQRLVLGQGATAARVAVTAQDVEMGETCVRLLEPGQTVVAFTGPKRGKADEALLYLAQGTWATAKLHSEGVWSLTKIMDQQAPDNLFGTYNGRADRLAELVAAFPAGQDFFPAVPAVRFAEDRELGRLPGPGRGLALCDLDGDGDLDVYACSPAGDRAFLQTAPLVFSDGTAALGLAGLASPSVGVADADGDGRPDLLAGGLLLLADGKGGFRRGPDLGLEAGRLKMACFLEYDGDGRPDILASSSQGGLRLLVNRGAEGFQDVSQTAGLRNEACGPAATGFVCWGDVDGDGRNDLFYAAQGGLLLLQDPQGVFQPARLPGSWRFEDAQGQAGEAGAGCIAALWRHDALSVAVAGRSELLLLAHEGGRVVDVTGEGNEITESTPEMLGSLAEDLDADGQVDLYSLSRSEANILHLNRGCGSFIAPHKYLDSLSPGKAHQAGAWGAAAGDVDGDGAIDLVLCGHDGAVTLLPNASLALRQPPEEGEALPHHDRIRLQARTVAVTVTGKKGVLGTQLTLRDAQGRIAARRTIGNQVLTGCRGPDRAVITVLWPGRYVLTARFGDGRTRSLELDLTRPGLQRLELANGP